MEVAIILENMSIDDRDKISKAAPISIGVSPMSTAHY